MAKLYWRVKVNGKWTFRDMYEEDAYAVCECEDCSEEEE